MTRPSFRLSARSDDGCAALADESAGRHHGQGSDSRSQVLREVEPADPRRISWLSILSPKPVRPGTDGREVTTLSFARLNPQDDVDVLAEIEATNRMLERRFPDCTVERVGVGDYGRDSQWVTVELENSDESPTCMEWYCAELARRNVARQEIVRM